MLTEAQIHFNYQEALNQARALDAAAADLERTQKDIKDTMYLIAVNWKGDNAAKYQQKGEALRAQTAARARDLREAAGEVRQVAQAIYQAEMRNLEIARQNRF